MHTHKCPNCFELIQMAEIPKIGDVVHCEECKTTFEIVWLFPLELLQANLQLPTTVENISKI